MHENKAEIVKALLPVLQMTRMYRGDLFDLQYEKHPNDYETVTAVFSSGYKKVANVSMDSGEAMIRDILNQIR